MKNQLRALLLSFIVMVAVANASAQTYNQVNTKYYSPRFGDNIYISIGAGAQAYLNSYNKDFFKKSVTPAFNLSVGKNFSPVWGVRTQFSAYQTKVFINGENDPLEHKYVGIGMDFMVNVTNIFRQYEQGRWFDVLAFAGPGVYVGRFNLNNDKVTALINGSAGLGLKFHVSNSFAIDIEGRASDFPSMYPITANVQDQIITATAGLTYTFSGRKFAASNSLKNVIEQAMYDDLLLKATVLAAENNALKNRKPQVVENVLVEEVIVYPELPPASITFAFNSSKVVGAQTVLIFNWSKFLKDNPNQKISITGYADKVGPKMVNEEISIQRADAVKDMLVKKYGISPDRIATQGKGYADIYKQNDWNRCALIELAQ